jgi:hypothetical protein
MLNGSPKTENGLDIVQMLQLVGLLCVVGYEGRPWDYELAGRLFLSHAIFDGSKCHLKILFTIR